MNFQTFNPCFLFFLNPPFLFQYRTRAQFDEAVLQEVAQTGTTELAELNAQDRQEYFHHLAQLPADNDRQRRRNVSSVILDTADISGKIWIIN